jgi:TRAP-type C4-dicarboxylate transport system permease small subunit
MSDRAADPQPIVQATDRHLKWRALDGLERVLMILCGICLAGVTISVLGDVVTRTIGHPWLWLQEVTMACFTYGVFTGTAAATRRNDHLYLSAMTEAMGGTLRCVAEVFNRGVVCAVGLAMVVFGWQNFLQGFGSFRMPSMTPIAYLYWPIPVCGALVALFSAEKLVLGLRRGFADPNPGALPVQVAAAELLLDRVEIPAER